MAKQEPASRHRLLVFVESPRFLPQDVFSRLPIPHLMVNSPAEVQEILTQERPIGLCLILSKLPDVGGSLESFLLKLDQGMHFEGLRVVLMVPKAFLGRESDFAPLFRYLGFRDCIFFDANFGGDIVRRQETVERLMFAIGLGKENPFSGHFGVRAECAGTVALTFPARLSWLQDRNILGVESPLWLTPDTECSLRLRDPGHALREVVLAARVVTNCNQGLRFNYGNCVEMRLTWPSVSRLEECLGLPGTKWATRRSVRRALVVTRTSLLRRRLLRTLSRLGVEARVPLVRRNIISDLPKLQPHFVFLEDIAVMGEGLATLRERIEAIRDAAGSQCRVCLFTLGEEKSPISGFHDVEIIDQHGAIDERLTQLVSTVFDSNDEERIWMVREAPGARIALSVIESVSSVSPRGLCIETRNRYRLWTNHEAKFGDGSFVGKVCDSSVMCDGFGEGTVSWDTSGRLLSVGIAALSECQALDRSLQQSLRDRLLVR